MAKRFTTVTEYLAAQAPKARAAVRRIRALLREEIPEAELGIGYQIPVLRLDKRPVIYFAGWSTHVSLYPVTHGLVRSLGDALVPYRASKGTLRFSLDAKLPEKLIRRIARVRLQETRALAKKR